MGKAGRRNLAVVALVAIAALATSASWGAAAGAATGDPETVVETPVAGSNIAAGAVAITGIATDDVAVASVRYGIWDVDAKRWLRPDGSWTAARFEFAAVLAAPGARTTAWSGAWAGAVPGHYAIAAIATDDAGHRDPTQTWQRFSVAQPTDGDAGYLTILFGRAMWVTADQCRSLPGAVDLATVADALAARGRTATAAAVVSRIQQSTRNCWRPYALQASWDDLATFRDRYGWSVVSDGLTHDDITKMGLAQQRAESCGTLPTLAAHGHTRAWGLFAYGGNNWSDQVQADVVSTCFSYGRRYRGGINLRGQTVAPWFQKTNSVLGGRCNDTTRPCATMPMKNNRTYWLPSKILNQLPDGPNQWTVLQFYRLVSGRQSVAGWSWDCTANDARAHWTSDPELYCYEDFRTVLDALPSDVVTVDPATVGTAWGRSFGG